MACDNKNLLNFVADINQVKLGYPPLGEVDNDLLLRHSRDYMPGELLVSKWSAYFHPVTQQSLIVKKQSGYAVFETVNHAKRQFAQLVPYAPAKMVDAFLIGVHYGIMYTLKGCVSRKNPNALKDMQQRITYGVIEQTVHNINKVRLSLDKDMPTLTMKRIENQAYAFGFLFDARVQKVYTTKGTDNSKQAMYFLQGIIYGMTRAKDRAL